MSKCMLQNITVQNLLLLVLLALNAKNDDEDGDEILNRNEPLR